MTENPKTELVFSSKSSDGVVRTFDGKELRSVDLRQYFSIEVVLPSDRLTTNTLDTIFRQKSTGYGFKVIWLDVRR